MVLPTCCYQIFCCGCTYQDFTYIRDHLVSTGLFLVLSEEDAAKSECRCPTGIDVVLVGRSDLNSCEIQQFRTDFPNTVIVRCICENDPGQTPPPLFSCFDGDCFVDLSSSSWGYNLVGIIFQALRFQNKSRSSDGTDGIYQQIFDKNPIPIALTLPENGTFVEVNEAFLKTYGYHRDEVIGKRSFDLNIFVSKEERDDILISCTEQYPCRDKETNVRTKDNQILTVLFSADYLLSG